MIEYIIIIRVFLCLIIASTFHFKTPLKTKMSICADIDISDIVQLLFSFYTGNIQSYYDLEVLLV